LPLNARLDVAALVDVVVQEAEDVLALLALKADDVPRELAVDVERLVARDRVPAHDRVHGLDGLAPDDPAAVAAARELGLLDARVHGLERAQERDELRRELAERLYLAASTRQARRARRAGREHTS
jgi:hypothetical protein